MNTYLRVSILGFAAGLLALLTLIALVYLALVISTMTFTFVDALAKARAAGIALEGQIGAWLGQSFVTSGWNALRGLWGLWGAFVVFGLLGLLAAWGQQIGQMVYPAHAWRIGFLWVAILVIIAAITWIYVQGEQIALWMAESPETYRWRELLLDSQTAAIMVGPLFALAFAYPAWVAWRWWYTWLHRWRSTGNDAVLFPVNSAHSSADDYRGYATRLAALKRGAPMEPDSARQPVEAGMLMHHSPPSAGVVYSNGLLAFLALMAAGCFAGYLITTHYHARVALRLQHGMTFIDATTQPRTEFALQVAPDLHRLRIVNINGLGHVSLTLSPAANPTEVVGAAPEWKFKWRADDYLYQDMPVQNLAPGDYILRFEQRSGWGYFEYMLSQGGGRASQALAVATGLLFATALILASALVVLTVARMLSASTAFNNRNNSRAHRA
jgi:hypothetical protein